MNLASGTILLLRESPVRYGLILSQQDWRAKGSLHACRCTCAYLRDGESGVVGFGTYGPLRSAGAVSPSVAQSGQGSWPCRGFLTFEGKHTPSRAACHR